MIYCRHKYPPGFCPFPDCSHRIPNDTDFATKVTGLYGLPGPEEWRILEDRLCDALTRAAKESHPP